MPISYARHRFPPEVIQPAVWLYLRCTLSYRDVEDLLAERGLEISYETARRWVDKFGSAYARELRSRGSVTAVAPRRKGGADQPQAFLLVARSRRRRRGAQSPGAAPPRQESAMRLMRKLLRKTGVSPELLVTDKLRSYGAAFHEIGLTARHEQGLRKNNRAENSHQPVRRANAICSGSNPPFVQATA